MVDVIAAVDSVTGAFGPLVQNRLHTDMQTAINDGVTTTVAALPEVAEEVAAAITPTFLNPIVDARLVAVGVKSPNGRNGITGWWHIEDFGAVPDLGASTRPQIQAAIDAANAYYLATGASTPQTVFFSDRQWLLDTVTFTQTGGSADGICCLWLKDGVELRGPATLTVLNGQYGDGAFFAMVRSRYEGASHVTIRDLKFNGNRSHQPTSNNAGNILIEAKTDVRIINVASVESNGNAIMVRGNAYGDQASDIRIQNCYVDGVNGIGIQSSQFNGLLIEGCTVKNTSDNSIDVYGEYAATVTTTSHGTDFQILNNNCSGGLVGLFLETVAFGLVAGNRVKSCGTGLRSNRINGQPTSLNIRVNSFDNCTVGAAFSGDQVNVTFSNNEISRATSVGVNFDGLRVSGIFGSDNLINGNSTSVPLVQSTSYCSVLGYTYFVRTITASPSSPSFVNYASSTVSCSIATATGPGF